MSFGKYKGQPVEALMHDRQYCEWLLQQPWFVEKFGHIHTLIINNYGEPAETPEHNQLQAMFLDPWFRSQYLEQVCKIAIDGSKVEAVFELAGADVTLLWQEPGRYATVCQRSVYVECKPTMGDDYPAVLRKMDLTLDRLRLKYHDGFSVNPQPTLLIGFGGYTGSVPAYQMEAIFASRKALVGYVEELMPLVESSASDEDEPAA